MGKFAVCKLWNGIAAWTWNLQNLNSQSQFLTHKRTRSPYPCTVCWVEVKVAVLCAQQYMPWNLLLIKLLNNFWYFKHQILTKICSEAYLKHNWRNCLWKSKKLQFLKTISSKMLQICFWASPSRNLVFEISKIIQNFD